MLKRIIIAPIRFYQRWLSPLKARPTCRYLPTCSSYAIEAVQKRGVAVGLALALWRLLRCNPLFRGGYDPVDRASQAKVEGAGTCAARAAEPGDAAGAARPARV